MPRGLTRESFPRRIRLSVPGTSASGIGDAVTVRARLFPPSGPVRPGGYDYSFRAYFDRIGATGFSFGAPKPADLGAPPLFLKAKRQLADLRQRISDRINRLLGDGDRSALAAALLVGDRSGLSPESEEALRQAGLAHILAISGLHMALFAGGTYAVFLMLLSLSQTAALHYPTHRMAAGAALLAAICYLALSGASVATQRSFIMVFLVFPGRSDRPPGPDCAQRGSRGPYTSAAGTRAAVLSRVSNVIRRCDLPCGCLRCMASRAVGTSTERTRRKPLSVGASCRSPLDVRPCF